MNMKIKQEVERFEYNVNSFLNQENPKAKGIISNIEIYFNKKFNLFQRSMWKTCFGLEIINLNKEKDEE